MAQKNTPPNPQAKSAGGPPPKGFPIDGGVLVGLCIGAFYGAKKILAKK